MNDSNDGGILVAIHEYKGENERILDSGCSFHMTPNKDFFTTYKRVDGGNVTLGNNVTCKVVDVGSIQVMFDSMVRTLVDVRHVPGLKKNLISLGTLDKNGCRISCQGGVMKVIRGSLILTKGEMNRSLYSQVGSTISGSVNVSTSIMFDEETKLWHLRFGHMVREACMS